MTERLSGGMLNVLRGVEAGKAIKVYRGKGNAFKRGQGLSAFVLRKAEEKGFIADGKAPRGNGFSVNVPMVLTKAGRAALDAAAVHIPQGSLVAVDPATGAYAVACGSEAERLKDFETYCMADVKPDSLSAAEIGTAVHQAIESWKETRHLKYLSADSCKALNDLIVATLRPIMAAREETARQAGWDACHDLSGED